MLAFSSIRRRPGWLAVVAHERRVTLAHVLRRAGARPEVCRLESFNVETSELAALQRLRAARELKAYACTTLLPAGAYELMQLETPSVPRDERNEALRWQIKSFVDFPIETACIDSLEVPLVPRERPASVFAVAAAEARVRACAELFDAARIPLQAIDIPELAQRNVAALLEEKDRGLAFLRVDSGGGSLTLTFRGELIGLRRVDVSAGQLVSSDSEARTALVERLVLEVQRSLDNFDRQFSSISISRLVAAMSPRSQELASALARSVDMPVGELDLAAVLDFPSVPELRDPQFQARHVLSIGAALRSEPTAVDRSLRGEAA